MYPPIVIILKLCHLPISPDCPDLAAGAQLAGTSRARRPEHLSKSFWCKGSVDLRVDVRSSCEVDYALDMALQHLDR